MVAICKRGRGEEEEEDSEGRRVTNSHHHCRCKHWCENSLLRVLMHVLMHHHLQRISQRQDIGWRTNDFKIVLPCFYPIPSLALSFFSFSLTSSSPLLISHPSSNEATNIRWCVDENSCNSNDNGLDDHKCSGNRTIWSRSFVWVTWRTSIQVSKKKRSVEWYK